MYNVKYMHLHLKPSKHAISYFNYFKIFTLQSRFELGQMGMDAICEWQTMKTTDPENWILCIRKRGSSLYYAANIQNWLFIIWNFSNTKLEIRLFRLTFDAVIYGFCTENFPSNFKIGKFETICSKCLCMCLDHDTPCTSRWWFYLLCRLI